MADKGLGECALVVLVELHGAAEAGAMKYWEC